MSLPRRDREIRHTLHAQLIPNGRQVVALVELNLIGDDTGAVLFVGRVLQVPASLRLLDEAAHNRMLVSIDHAPNLEILDSVTLFILGRTLPGDQVSTEWRETQLEDILGRKGSDDMSDGGVNDGDPREMIISTAAATQWQ